MPSVSLETSFDKPLEKKKDIFDFLYHICRLDVHGFCPLGEITMIPFIYSWWCIIVLVRRKKWLKAIKQNDLIGSNRCWPQLSFSHFDLLKWFFRREKLSDIFFIFLLNIPYRCLFFGRYNKKESSLCLFERHDGPKLPHLCLYQQFFTRVISQHIFR